MPQDANFNACVYLSVANIIGVVILRSGSDRDG